MGVASNFSEWRRPLRCLEINPALSSIRRCLETAGSDIAKGFAKSVTQRSPVASRFKIRRLVGSANAENVRSKTCAEWLTIWLNICPALGNAKGKIRWRFLGGRTSGHPAGLRVGGSSATARCLCLPAISSGVRFMASMIFNAAKASLAA